MQTRTWSIVKARQTWTAIVALSLVVGFGTLLRVHDVDRRALNHPEVYAPGIDLPWGLTNPNPRFSLWQTLAGTIAGEPHPPAYYIVMLGWTKWFGSSIFSLRFPSLLFGIASILLIYVLATRTEDTLTGVLAAAMLAANGLHLYWSQNARMYSMACFLGLLATLLLLLIEKNAPHQCTYRVLYLVFTLTGLATHVYFWGVFATHILWVLARSLRRHTASAPSLLRLQIFTFIAASPLVAIAVYQSDAATRPRTLSPVEGMLRFLQLGSLLEIDPLAISAASLHNLAALAALIATIILAGSAFRTQRGDLPQHHQVTEQDSTDYGAPGLPLAATVGVLMALIILAFAYLAGTILPQRSTHLVIATSLLPIALVLTDFWIRQHWQRLQGFLGTTTTFPMTFRSLYFLLAAIPVTMLAGISLVNPMFIQRGTLIFVPYLLIVLSIGLASLLRTDRRWLAIVIVVAAIHGFSILDYKSRLSNPDYKSLAEQWIPRIEDSDLILVHGRGRPGDWLVAPIFYYVNAARYHFVGTDFVKELHTNPRPRVWVLSLPSFPTENEITDALAGYRLQGRLDALNISAMLYVRDTVVMESPAEATP